MLLINISTAAGKKQKKRKKGKGQLEDDPSPPDVCIQLLQSSSSTADVPAGTPNSEAWRSPAALRVGSEVFEIEINPPTVTSLDLHPRPMVSYPVIPLPVVQYAAEGDCEWLWERLQKDNGSKASSVVLDCTERVYVPVDADAGCCLRVTCTPTATSASGIHRGDVLEATTGVLTNHACLPEPPQNCRCRRDVRMSHWQCPCCPARPGSTTCDMGVYAENNDVHGTARASCLQFPVLLCCDVHGLAVCLH